MSSSVALYRQAFSLSDFVPPWKTSARSSWIYVDMEKGVRESRSDYSESSYSISTTTSISSLYKIPEKIRKLSCSSDCSACKATSFVKLLLDTSADLWKDNPDRDLYNTFSVSEDDLTNAIAHLEQKLGTPAYNHEGFSSSMIFRNGAKNEFLKKELHPRISFILDSYCNIYMSR